MWIEEDHESDERLIHSLRRAYGEGVYRLPTDMWNAELIAQRRLEATIPLSLSIRCFTWSVDGNWFVNWVQGHTGSLCVFSLFSPLVRFTERPLALQQTTYQGKLWR